MKNIRKDNFVFTGLITFIIFIVTSSVCNAAEQIKGFYPVSSKGEFCKPLNSTELPHNPYYKEWCQKNFRNGSQIYEAYRQVAFNIEYTPEPPRVDLWQTPSETMRSHKGDCEDAILLFHQKLPVHYNGGEIIWGFVHDLEKKIFFPHVWFQLSDKNGNIYIVEPFSGDWNGIIPIKLLKDSEVRQRIIGIPNSIISDLMNKPSEHDSIKRFFIRQVTMYDWRLVKQVDNVFAKLASVSSRYRQQQR